MRPVLVDTSVWIDALNGKKNKQVSALNKLIDGDHEIVLCPIIIQEILQGIKNDLHYQEVKDSLEGFAILSSDAVSAAIGAADLYRKLRKKGVTIRKSNDCLIAWFALEHKTILLHKDADFDKIVKYTNLQVMA